MKGKRYLLLALVFIVGLVFLALWIGQDDQGQSARSLREYKEVFEGRTLRILSPYSACSREGKQEQELEQFLNFVKKEKGLNISLRKENDHSKAFEYLLSGGIDLICEKLIITARIDTTKFAIINEEFSKPIYLVQRADSLAIKSHFDLAYKTICLPKDSELQIFVEHLSKEIAEPVYIDFDSLYTSEQLILKVLDGKIDYTLCTSEEAKYYMKEFEGLDISLPISFGLRCAWLGRKSSPILCDSIEQWVKESKIKRY